MSEAHKLCLSDKKAEKPAKRSQRIAHLCCLLRMTNIWLAHDKGSIVSDPSAVAKVCGLKIVIMK